MSGNDELIIKSMKIIPFSGAQEDWYNGSRSLSWEKELKSTIKLL